MTDPLASLPAIASAMHGQLLGPWHFPRQNASGSWPAISTDSRNVAPGSLFFALKGERTDGHQYLFEAASQGPLALVLHDAAALQLLSPNWNETQAVILVKDTAQALLDLASAHRARLTAEVIAVGGSNGKTTTCRLLSAILSATKAGNASKKSFNNSIGVPLTILATSPLAKYLICEVGTNAPGEVAPLIRVINPTCSIITSIGREHLEGFGNLDGVITEELQMLAPGVPAFIPDEPPHLHALAVKAVGNPNLLTTFGFSPRANIRVQVTGITTSHTAFILHQPGYTPAAFQVPLPGAHNATNAAAAIGVARASVIPDDVTAAALATATGPDMRMQQVTHAGISFTNDAYNANPDSALAAIHTFAAIHPPRHVPSHNTPRRIFVFGDMLELGTSSDELHTQTLTAAIKADCFDLFLCVGPRTSRAAQDLGCHNTVCFADATAAATAAPSLLRAGDSVLLKASRGTGLERLLAPFASP